MSMGEKTRGGAKENLGDKICTFLKGKEVGAKCTALEIAKGVGLTTTSDVNSVLYGLQKTGRLLKTGERPPLWSLASPSRSPKASPVHKPTAPPSDIQTILKSQVGRQGITAQRIAKELSLQPKNVNKELYSMHERREVERSEENPPRWYWRDGETDTNNETEESSDSEDDSKLSSSGIDTGSESPSARSEVSQKPVSRFSDDFDLIEKLGEGGYGRVYKVKGKLAEVLYAVKVVEYDRYALREVKALASFQHPNIVRYYAAWPELSDLQASTASPASTESTYESEDEEDQSESSGAIMTSNKDKYLYIQMEFCKGGNLKQWICEKNEGNMQSRDDALMIFQQIVQGVEYIHLQGHIHRDLKPENILFGNDNKVKIGDLGLVTVISEEGSNSVKRTKQKGTPSYMSPEQENLRTYDEKVDIYPLGLICFELLWEMRTGMERSRLLENLRERIFPPEFVRQYSSEHKLIKKMLSKAPDKRPAASAIAQGLRVLMEEHDGLGDLKTV